MASSTSNKKTSGDATMRSSRLGWSNPEIGKAEKAKMNRAQRAAAKLNQGK
jgi:hypothetical protein